nr:hypothetical protein [Vibrio splendidus]MCC4882954.1 hypothetical protein [Vibrio splendidus]
MIKYSIIETEDNKLIALAHSEGGEFIGIAHATKNEVVGIIEIDNLVTRYQSEMMLLRAIGGYAEDNGLRVAPCPNKLRTRNRDREEMKLWESMLGLSEYDATRRSDAPEQDFVNRSLSYAFNIPCDARTKRHSAIYHENSVPGGASVAWELGESISRHVLQSPTVVYIEDEYPLPPANPLTGENIFTAYQVDQVIEEYTSGKCMFLALALHERFGLDVDMHIIKYQGNWCIEHAWCSSGTDGIDIIGVQENYKWDSLGSFERAVSKDQIFSLMANSSEYPGFSVDAAERAVLDAHRVIDNYLLDYHPSVAHCPPSLKKESLVSLIP